MTFLGTCGWREARAKYFAHFPVVELQDTFYEPPSIALATKWRELAPPEFQFCVKAWQLITHTSKSPTYRRLKSKLSASEMDLTGGFQPTEQVWLAWERTEAIARALRATAVLFQCPKSFEPNRANVANFREFFARIEPSEFRLAWEPRGDWSVQLVRELCAEFNLIHCVDPFDRDAVAGDLTYWRLHGRGGYSYRYSNEELDELRVKLERSVKPAYVFFNNVWMKEDALRFQQMLELAKVQVHKGSSWNTTSKRRFVL